MKLVKNTIWFNRQLLIDYLWISFASVLTAIAVNNFFIHDGLAPGGLTGLSLIVSQILHLDVEIISLAISIPVLLIATFVLGKAFGIKTLYMIIVTPIFMGLLPTFWVTAFLNSISSLFLHYR